MTRSLTFTCSVSWPWAIATTARMAAIIANCRMAVLLDETREAEKNKETLISGFTLGQLCSCPGNSFKGRAQLALVKDV